MPLYFYWGEDDFRLSQAVVALRDRALDAAWVSFNYDKIPPEIAEAPLVALNQAMTPPFGSGQRVVWLVNTTLGQKCPEPILKEFERTLPQLPDSTLLLLTSGQKPDGRAKFTKLVQRHGQIKAFDTIPPWQTDQLAAQVKQAARDRALTLTEEAADLLVIAVGNQMRQLNLELEKLALYWGDRPGPIDAVAVEALVTISAQSSLQLAIALREGKVETALGLVADLLQRNEPALRIVATLVGQFRTWLWVKMMMTSGERDASAIAKAAEIGNPKRVYILQKEVSALSLTGLQQALGHLLTLEAALKRGRDETATLQTKMIEICQLFTTGMSRRGR
ncbi:DNA polymerase III subunit delta [Leptolyngbya sp. PCC 6406]|uniref:DNA polymerase III subunit delta n=1 Tax=Leptolyngbya sp. PCC 6406 TaxID=1173264 RepID=UPI0002ABDDDA|nr:DNA polymerase III subunit delta [Leptolyngbya sp. PCC 6406]